MWPFGRRKTQDLPLGGRGEQIAADFLRKQGLVILARNFRCPSGEVDIVALDKSTGPRGGETIVFVEVKTRRDDRVMAPETAVDARKQDQVRRAARYYLAGRDTTGLLTRFDIVAIVLPQGQQPRIRHLVNAFE